MGLSYIRAMTSAVGAYLGRRRIISGIGSSSTLSSGIEAAFSSSTMFGKRASFKKALGRVDELLTGNAFGAYGSTGVFRTALETFISGCNKPEGASLFFWLGDLCSRLKIVRDSNRIMTLEIQRFYSLDPDARNILEHTRTAWHYY